MDCWYKRGNFLPIKSRSNCFGSCCRMRMHFSLMICSGVSPWAPFILGKRLKMVDY